MAGYKVEAKQFSGDWMDMLHMFFGKSDAILFAKASTQEWGNPRRVVDEKGEVIATVGETPEWEELAARIRAKVAEMEAKGE